MPNEHPLMRPLRSDSLKARSALQAQWTPKETLYPFVTSETTPAQPVQTEPPPVPESEILPEAAKEDFCDPAPHPYNEDKSVFQLQSCPPTLSETIADIMSSSAEEDDDEESPLIQDAVPDRLIPQPVCVPLFEQDAPTRKKRRWLWLLLPLFTAGAVFAAWKYGFLSFILA